MVVNSLVDVVVAVQNEREGFVDKNYWRKFIRFRMLIILGLL